MINIFQNKKDIPPGAIYVYYHLSGKDNDLNFLYKIIDSSTLRRADNTETYSSGKISWREMWCGSDITLYFEEDIPQLLVNFPELII